MPSKVYLESPPHGDFRAMPALGGGFAMLKWISSFPGNPAQHGLPTVMGVVCLSDATTSAPRLLLDARAVTALRTGRRRGGGRAGARARGRAHRRRDRLRPARRLGGALPRRRGLRPGRLLRPATGGGRGARGRSSAGGAGTREEALACDVVCCVTPGFEPVVEAADLRPGVHLNMLGADGPGKAEATHRGRHPLRAVLRRVGPGLPRRGAHRRGRGRRDHARRRHRPRRRPGRRRARAPGRRRGHALRLDGPGDPGPGDRRRRPRGPRRGPRGARRRSALWRRPPARARRVPVRYAAGPLTPLTDFCPRSTR